SSMAGRHGMRGEPEIIYLQAASDRQHAMLLVLLKSGVVNATKQVRPQAEPNTNHHLASFFVTDERFELTDSICHGCVLCFALLQRVFEACKADDLATFNRLLQTVAEEDQHYILHSPNSSGDWIIHVAAEGRPNVLGALVSHTNEF